MASLVPKPVKKKQEVMGRTLRRIVRVILDVCACIKFSCIAKVPIKCCGAWARFSMLPQQPIGCYNYLARFFHRFM